MRILHILAPGEAGGLGRIVQALALGHAARGVEVHLAVILDAPEPDHPFFVPLRGSRVVVHSLVIPRRAYRGERAAVAALLRRLRPQVVHTHGYRPDVLDAGVARRAGLPVVTTVHGFTGGDWKNRLYERLQRWSFRRFDAVVAVSAPMAEELARDGVPRERIQLVPNAWSEIAAPLDPEAARAELGVPPGTPHLGWVGRLSAEKGPDVLVDAVATLPEPLLVSVIGDGREREPLRARAAALGAADRLRWHGTRADAARYFPGFDLFVLSSHTEGTPVVLFEAIAAGVPVVATAVGGVPDVVGADGALLVPAGDAAALAVAIRQALADPVAAARRAAAARERVRDRFGVEPWLDGYERIYRAVSAGATPEPLVLEPC